MKEDDKVNLINKMIDNPDSLTNQDLDAILKDPKIKEIYEISSTIKGFTVSGIEVNGMKEWELFRPRIQNKTNPFKWIMRVASIFLGIMCLSYVVDRIINMALDQQTTTVISKTNEIYDGKHQNGMKNQTFVVSSEDTSQKVVEVSNVEVAPKREIKNPSSSLKSIKEKIDLETSELNEVDIDEYLRIQEAKIENELAFLNAQIYLLEIERIKFDLLNQGLDEEWIDKEIKKITTQ